MGQLPSDGATCPRGAWSGGGGTKGPWRTGPVAPMLPTNPLSQIDPFRCNVGVMNVRRFTSILVLGALLLAQAPPAQAGRMLCRMKTPARTESCSRCDDARAGEAVGILRAASCCRIAPAPATEATPLVLSSRALSTDDPLPLLAAPAATLRSALERSTEIAPLPLARTGPTDPLPRTTILRN